MKQQENQTLNQLYKAAVKSGKYDGSFKDFADLANTYASERISRNDLAEGQEYFNHDTGAQETGQPNAYTEQHQEPLQVTDNEVIIEAEETILGLKKTTFYLLLAVLCIAAGVGAYFLFFNNKKEDSVMSGTSGTEDNAAPATENVATSGDDAPGKIVDEVK